MGSHGSPGARFDRALRTGNPLLVKAAALEVGHLSLADALRYTIFLAEHADEEEYERVAVRFHARWAIQTRPTADEAVMALSALRALQGSAATVARSTLRQLAEARRRDDLVQALSDC